MGVSPLTAYSTFTFFKPTGAIMGWTGTELEEKTYQQNITLTWATPSLVSAVSTHRHFRPDQGNLVVPRTKTACFGPQSFSVAGSLEWNSLPPEIKTSSLAPGQFSGRLKTEMFLHSTGHSTHRSCYHWRPCVPVGCRICLEQSAGVSSGIANTASLP